MGNGDMVVTFSRPFNHTCIENIKKYLNETFKLKQVSIQDWKLLSRPLRGRANGPE